MQSKLKQGEPPARLRERRSLPAGNTGTGRAQSTLSLNGVALTRRTSLALPEQLAIDSWCRIGRQISLISNSSAWWLGDWLIFGEERYPDRYKRALAGTALDYQTLRNYAWVARRFPPSRRRDALSFQHHAEVAGLPEHEQQIWLDRAEQAKWPRNKLRRELQLSRRNPELPTAVFLRMNVATDQQQRWQEAADKNLCSFVDWVIRALDQAAEMALPASDHRALGSDDLPTSG